MEQFFWSLAQSLAESDFEISRPQLTKLLLVNTTRGEPFYAYEV